MFSADGAGVFDLDPVLAFAGEIREAGLVVGEKLVDHHRHRQPGFELLEAQPRRAPCASNGLLCRFASAASLVRVHVASPREPDGTAQRVRKEMRIASHRTIDAKSLPEVDFNCGRAECQSLRDARLAAWLERNVQIQGRQNTNRL